MKHEPEHLGAFVILLHKGKALLGKRKNSYKSGYYGFPGGRLELAESILDCAKRELLEETGVTATKLEYIGVVRELQDGYNFIHFGFSCSEYEGKIEVVEKDKCEKWEFFELDAIPSNTLPAHLAGVKLLQSPIPQYIDLI